MSYKFDRRKPGESLRDYLIRHKAHPMLTPTNARIKMSEEEAMRLGILAPPDADAYLRGDGLGLTCGSWERGKSTTYYVIGPGQGTNLIKDQGKSLYILNDANEWEERPSIIRHLMEPDARELTLQEAQEAFTRITGERRWVP